MVIWEIYMAASLDDLYVSIYFHYIWMEGNGKGCK